MALAVPAIAAPAPESTSLQAVQDHLAKVNSMTADFSQTDRNGKVLTGKLTLKKPGKIRFQYEKGVPYLVVSNGKAIYFIDYSVGDEQRYPIGNSPLSILLDPSRDASKFAKIVPTADPRIVSVEAYDPKNPQYGRITLIFAKQGSAPGGLMLEGWVTLDAQGNRTTIRLDDQKFNVPVSDRMFRWNDPKRAKRPH
nr:outer membrane lipoprotein carrier protein LolA [Stakelama marina]